MYARFEKTLIQGLKVIEILVKKNLVTLTKIKNVNPNAVLFKSLDGADQNKININTANIELICYGVLSNNLDASEADLMLVLLKNLHEASVVADVIKTNTREQASYSCWFDI